MLLLPHLLSALLLAPHSVAAAPAGLWHARLVPTPGNEVAFDVRVTSKSGALSAVLVNARSEAPFTSATWDGETLTLSLAHFDGRIVARRNGDGLAGSYSRFTTGGVIEVPFEASSAAPPTPRPAKGSPSVSGTYGVEIGTGKSVEKLSGLLKQSGGTVTGTMRTTTGDYGALHGTFDGTHVVLMVFDGVHIYRFTAERQPDGTLAGEYRSRANPPVPWIARPLTDKAADTFIPDAFEVVKPKDPAAPYRFAFEDESGARVTEGDARFAGKPMLVVFMGTWCPNCNDEAPVVRDLYRRYHEKGLDVVALAFEYTDDVERNRRQVKRFKERYGIPYTVLIAGTTASAPTSSSMTQLDGWQGYPTTLFLDRSHRVVKAHSGFDGPATGEHHVKLKKEMEEAVRRLLGAAG